MNTLDISLEEIVEFIKTHKTLLRKKDDKSSADALTIENPDLKTILYLLEQIEEGDRVEKEIDSGIHHDDYPDNQIEIGDHLIAQVIDHVKELISNESDGIVSVGGKRKSRKNKRSRKSRKSTKTKRSRKSRKTTRRRRVRKYR